ncbi:hypothetical protein [Streptomyces sp. NPDC059071]|uniref:hypothetical protein n=1 Tax=unclassified Streptomyces TaxID=2593676 RepID=UPI0036457390
MTTHSPWRGLGAVGLRLADVAGRYLLTYLAAFLAVGLTEPRVTDSWHEPSAFPSRAEVVLESLRLGVDLVWIIPVPSLLIVWLFALFSERTGLAFRGRLAGLLMAPLWFLFLTFAGSLLLFLVLAHLVFALLLMRAPLMRGYATR